MVFGDKQAYLRLCLAFQKTSCYIILHNHVSAHIILDPASFFEVPFPILNPFLIPCGSSNWSFTASTHKTVIPARVSNGFLHKDLATQISGYMFSIYSKIFDFLVLLSLLALRCHKQLSNKTHGIKLIARDDPKIFRTICHKSLQAYPKHSTRIM